MSRLWLVICALAAVALINAAFLLPWFQLDFGTSRIAIGMHSAQVCMAVEGCRRVSFAGMSGAYPTFAAAAFWLAMPLALLVLVQATLKVIKGVAVPGVTKLGYALGIIVLLSAFAAGFLFAPETERLFGAMGIEAVRMWGPMAMLGGSVLAIIAFRGALVDAPAAGGDYQPVVLRDRIATPPAQNRIATPPAQQQRIATPPAQNRIGTPPARERLPDSLPLDGGVPDRTKSPSQPGERTKSPSQPGERTKSPSQPGERTKSPSQPGDRMKSPSQPGDRTKSPSQPGDRTKSPSQQPLVARTTSPSQLQVRARSGSQPPADAGPFEMPERARTSSSGPIDLAARLHGAPLGIAIKPPLPEPVPVPPDQIPVAPESGLVIRKRTPSAAPLGAGQLAAVSAPATAAPPRAATGRTPVGAMPSVGLRHASVDPDNPFASGPVLSTLDDMADLALDFGGPTQPLEGAPPPLRGKLNFAVTHAMLTSSGILAEREDGTATQVTWESIVGVIARRLPGDAPYDGQTFVDLVSTAGSTLRILPWTKLEGVPLAGEGEERARAFLRLVAGRCLDAKLDSWTRVFADGAGHAAQLPNEKTLASHDEIIA